MWLYIQISTPKHTAETQWRQKLVNHNQRQIWVVVRERNPISCKSSTQTTRPCHLPKIYNNLSCNSFLHSLPWRCYKKDWDFCSNPRRIYRCDNVWRIENSLWLRSIRRELISVRYVIAICNEMYVLWSQEFRHANAHAVMYARRGVCINRTFLVCDSVLGRYTTT